ncbi:glycoside hydrolase family 30 protein [Marasmius fiardii PR-910]|nr:glycoside hydrolase family 30 protein [Marasmius fiardii PR-910]
MGRSYSLACLLLFTTLSASQQICDIRQTTWDRSKLFDNVSPSSPIKFDTLADTSNVKIYIDDTKEAQEIVGFADSSALTLNMLKTTNSSKYWELLEHAFGTAYGTDSVGLSYIRVPLGASDFSSSLYSLDDTEDDTAFLNFDLDRAPSYLFSTLEDIRSVNNDLKVHLVAWSPPGWMKDGGKMTGGSLKPEMVKYYSTYLLKAVQGFIGKGIPIYAITVQNEPLHDHPAYPTCLMTPSEESVIGRSLRKKLDKCGLKSVKIIGFDHNWVSASHYPVSLMEDGGDAFAGVSFHCYEGNVDQQNEFHKAFPSKDIYFTECTGTVGSDWWSDMKWYMDNLWIGALERRAKTGLMWNLALDDKGNPKLNTTTSCPNGCRALISVSDGSYALNQEFLSMAHVSKVTIPRDPGGPSARFVGVSVSGSVNSTIRSAAFVSKRDNSNDPSMYSLVVLNQLDRSGDGYWNPTPVNVTIEFKGKQVAYEFPVGITTLSFYEES